MEEMQNDYHDQAEPLDDEYFAEQEIQEAHWKQTLQELEEGKRNFPSRIPDDPRWHSYPPW